VADGTIFSRDGDVWTSADVVDTRRRADVADGRKQVLCCSGGYDSASERGLMYCWAREAVRRAHIQHSMCFRHQTTVFYTASRDVRAHNVELHPEFLPPDAMHWRSYCYSDVAVCVSVALMYCTLKTESIIMRPLLDCSPATLVFPYQICTR